MGLKDSLERARDYMSRIGVLKPNDAMIAGLNEVMEKIVDSAKANAPTMLTAESISFRPAEVNERGKISGEIYVDLQIAPEARAYEFGSGIHATVGTPGTYPIFPKEKQALAFFWDKADPEKHRMLPDGRVVFSMVNHPGVAPMPFLKPAVEEHMDEIRRYFRNAVVEDFMAGFGVHLRR